MGFWARLERREAGKISLLIKVKILSLLKFVYKCTRVSHECGSIAFEGTGENSVFGVISVGRLERKILLQGKSV